MLKEIAVLEGFGLCFALCALLTGAPFWTTLWYWQLIVGPWILLSLASAFIGIIWYRVKGD